METLEGNNKFYLYTGTWYRLLSPIHVWSDGHAHVLFVLDIGDIRGYWDVSKDEGGVQISRIMLLIEFGRGWESESNPGNNTSYYLYTGAWYRALSPNHVGLDLHYQVIYIRNDGTVGNTWIDEVSGVQNNF